MNARRAAAYALVALSCASAPTRPACRNALREDLQQAQGGCAEADPDHCFQEALPDLTSPDPWRVEKAFARLGGACARGVCAACDEQALDEAAYLFNAPEPDKTLRVKAPTKAELFCIAGTDWKLHDCRIYEHLEGVSDEAVLKYVATWHVAPSFVHGKPVAMGLAVHLHIDPPKQGDTPR